MKRKNVYKTFGPVAAIFIGVFLLVYKVILANIDIPSLESISEMRGVVNSIVEKKDGISIRLDDIDGVFFLSHRAGDLQHASSLLQNLRGEDVVISVKSNGDYVPHLSDEVFRLVFGISSGGKTIISYSEVVKNWEAKSRKIEVAVVASLFILFGLYSIWKLYK